uniref:Uncharacterized protein n=1 Tax=Tetranychus urticae TaxID=32264 RepID=T1KM26_TETUR
MKDNQKQPVASDKPTSNLNRLQTIDSTQLLLAHGFIFIHVDFWENASESRVKWPMMISCSELKENKLINFR